MQTRENGVLASTKMVSVYKLLASQTCEKKSHVTCSSQSRGRVYAFPVVCLYDSTAYNNNKMAKETKQADIQLKERLISEVEQRLMIWDKRLKTHRDWYAIDVLWEEIANTLKKPSRAIYFCKASGVFLQCARIYTIKTLESRGRL